VASSQILLFAVKKSHRNRIKNPALLLPSTTDHVNKRPVGTIRLRCCNRRDSQPAPAEATIRKTAY